MNDSNRATKIVLQRLPIWPSLGTPKHCLTASVAYIAENYDLLAPWMVGYRQFVQPDVARSYSSTLELLETRKLSNIDLLKGRILSGIPGEMNSHRVKSYGTFLSAVALVFETNFGRHAPKTKAAKREKEQILSLLRNSKLALDGNYFLHTAGELFDHDDALYQAAFREETGTRFLHAAVRGHKQFWLEIGLRQRSNDRLAPKDYVLCLQTLKKRLEARKASSLDNQLVLDAGRVLNPLTSESGAMFREGFYEAEWRTIQREATFPALRNLSNQRCYRRDAMDALAVSKPLLSLMDVINHQYIPICWSQTSFSSLHPSGTTFSKIPSGGKPPVNMVWRHLNHLMQSAQHLGLTEGTIPDFLHDLTRTYDFLQENLKESCDTFTLVASPLWLNLAIIDDKWVGLEDLRSSWVKIEHLVLLSSCDSPPLVSVQPRLMRHQRLLKALGCRTIIYPTVTAVDIGTAESLSASMTRLRREGKMLDITLSADGKEVQAHKIVLAAVSASFEINFNGNWADDKKIDLKGISFDTLSAVVDFAYADIFDWTPWRVTDEDTVDVIADKLDNLLDLLTAADRFQMPGLQSQAEGEILSAGRSFIRIDNVLDIRDLTTQINAHHVAKACKEFYEKNKVPVDLVYAEKDT
jgi:sacsin